MTFCLQVYSNTPETINLIIEVFVEVAHKQICYLGEVRRHSHQFGSRVAAFSRLRIASVSTWCFLRPNP